jgi:acyl-CoA reductase-like NAD-dependent aldehyde dehydrogenase
MIRRENPARIREIVGTVAETSPVEVDAIVWASHADFRRGTPLDDRLASLTAAAETLEAALADLSVLLARETGKVLGDCRGEIGEAIRCLRAVVLQTLCTYGHRVSGVDQDRLLERPKPYGVVAAIVSWSSPILHAIRMIAPALAAGNAVVVKPSPLAPLTLDRIVRLIGGPLRIVHGGPETAAALVGHELIGRVAYAGGVFGARAVATMAADRLVPATLTLTGNEPIVFLDDAPFADDAMDRLVPVAFGKRLYVPAARLPEFADAFLASAARVLITGDPLADGVSMGPVVSAAAQQVAERLRTGGCRDLGKFEADPESGYFVKPALVVGPDPRGPFGTAGPFAPIVPVFGYDDEAAVPPGGSATAIFSADEGRAVDFARRFDGPVFVNTHPRRPDGAGLAEFSRTSVIHLPDRPT